MTRDYSYIPLAERYYYNTVNADPLYSQQIYGAAARIVQFVAGMGLPMNNPHTLEFITDATSMDLAGPLFAAYHKMTELEDLGAAGPEDYAAPTDEIDVSFIMGMAQLDGEPLEETREELIAKIQEHRITEAFSESAKRELRGHTKDRFTALQRMVVDRIYPELIPFAVKAAGEAIKNPDAGDGEGWNERYCSLLLQMGFYMTTDLQNRVTEKMSVGHSPGASGSSANNGQPRP